jgi:hypothetical protein
MKSQSATPEGFHRPEFFGTVHWMIQQGSGQQDHAKARPQTLVTRVSTKQISLYYRST